MKKLLVALTAALGLASAAVPASAGSSYSVTAGFYSAPTYTQPYVAPSYSHAPTYNYASPVYNHVTVPTYSYVAPAPVVNYGYGNGTYHTPGYPTYSYGGQHRNTYRHPRRARGHHYNW